MPPAALLMKDRLRKLFLQTLDKIALERVVPAQVGCRDGVLRVGSERIELDRFRRLLTVAFGKAAFQMAELMARTVAPRPLQGVVSGTTPIAQGRDPSPTAVFPALGNLELFSGGHPYPNADSFAAANAALTLLESTAPDDLVIFLLSGGGSAILERPISTDISLQECRDFYRLLVTCGVNIVDVNFVRKHFSAVKGGRLARAAYPARQLTLYVSDAPPGNPSNVASGPTMPDESSVHDCYRILLDNDLVARCPPSIRGMIEQECIPETPKEDSEVFGRSSWHCLLTPEEAMEVLAREARAAGWPVAIDAGIGDDCPMAVATGKLLARLQELGLEHPGKTVAVVSGGEYSCPVTGDGAGGRNQAFVLDCVEHIAGSNVAVLSAGTDGIDGTSPVAGAVADGCTRDRARAAGLDPKEYARRSDSHGFFSRLDDTLVTGPTGNNVRDLRILVAWPDD